MDALEERISKLPKWAQYHIHILERDLANASTRVEQIGGAVARGSSSISYETSSTQANLPDRSCVQFRLSDKRSVEISLRITGNKRYLRIYAGGGMLVLKPEISNVVNITVVDRCTGEED
jgi:hypothetical protein